MSASYHSSETGHLPRQHRRRAAQSTRGAHAGGRRAKPIRSRIRRAATDMAAEQSETLLADATCSFLACAKGAGQGHAMALSIASDAAVNHHPPNGGWTRAENGCRRASADHEYSVTLCAPLEWRWISNARSTNVAGVFPRGLPGTSLFRVVVDDQPSRPSKNQGPDVFSIHDPPAAVSPLRDAKAALVAYPHMARCQRMIGPEKGSQQVTTVHNSSQQLTTENPKLL